MRDAVSLVTSMAIVGWVVAFHATDAKVSVGGWTGPAGAIGNVVFGIGAAIVSAIALSLWVATFKWLIRRGGSRHEDRPARNR